MFDYLDADSIARLGGVAWAKRFAAQLQPGRVEELLGFWRRVERFAELLHDRYRRVEERFGGWEGRAARAAAAEVRRAVLFVSESLDTAHGMVAQLESARDGVLLALGRIRELPDEQLEYGPAGAEANRAARADAAHYVNSLSDCYLNAAAAFEALAAVVAVPFSYGWQSAAAGAEPACVMSAGPAGDCGPGPSLGTSSPPTLTPTPTAMPPGTAEASSDLAAVWTLSVLAESADSADTAGARTDNGLGMFGESGFSDAPPQQQSAAVEPWAGATPLFGDLPARHDGDQYDFKLGLFGDEGFA